MRGISLSVAIVLMVLIVSTVYLKDYADRPLSGELKDVHLEIVPGMSFKGVTGKLIEQGMIDEAWTWRIFATLKGVTHDIKAGEYLLPANLTPRQLLAKLVQGDTIRYSITIIEGSTFRQLWDAVKSHDRITQTLGSPIELQEKLGLSDPNPEGWFYPDTYHFSSGITDLQFFQRMHRYMHKVLDEEWMSRKEGVPVATPKEALILASIIEKETSVDQERNLIAAVFSNRLKRGMRLQADPTVIYGLGESFDGDIRRRDLKADTPYNTYIRKGLPPTPIALPGRASIAAALNPANSAMIYFVSKRDGTHHFSSTYKEHRAAVIKYQLRGCKQCYGGGSRGDKSGLNRDS